MKEIRLWSTIKICLWSRFAKKYQKFKQMGWTAMITDKELTLYLFVLWVDERVAISLSGEECLTYYITMDVVRLKYSSGGSFPLSIFCTFGLFFSGNKKYPESS